MGLYPAMRWFSCQRPVRPSDRGLGTGPHLADVLTHVFDDHLVGCNGLHGKQTPLMDPAAAEPELLLPELEGRRQTVLLAASLNLTPCCGCPPPRGGARFWPRASTPAPRRLRDAALPPSRSSPRVPAPHLELVQLQQITVHDGRRADGAQQPPLLRPALRKHAVSPLGKGRGPGGEVSDRRNHGKRCQGARYQGRALPECPLLPAAGPKQGTHPGTCPFPSC